MCSGLIYNLSKCYFLLHANEELIKHDLFIKGKCLIIINIIDIKDTINFALINYE